MANVLADLLEALEDVDDATREEAAKTLADLGDPATLDALRDVRLKAESFVEARGERVRVRS